MALKYPSGYPHEEGLDVSSLGGLTTLGVNGGGLVTLMQTVGGTTARLAGRVAAAGTPNIFTYTSPSAPGGTTVFRMFLVGAKATVTAFTSGTVQFQVQFTDDAGNFVTHNLAAETSAAAITTGLNALGGFSFPAYTILTGAGLTITAQMSEGAGAMTYNISAWIMQLT